MVFIYLFLIAVDIRIIKEVRRDRNSKEFEKWPDEARKYEKSHCFVIHYGQEFRLGTISCVGTFCLCYL